MTPRQFIIALAAALGAVAAILFMTPVSATTTGGKDISCGSVWSPDTHDAMYAEFGESMDNAFAHRSDSGNRYAGYAGACSDTRDTRGTWGYVLAGLCVIGLIGGGMVGRDLSKPPTWAEGKPEA
ncbi:hypothetical protein [Amycolatopsis kentuckyensis]|uniref:hypothetical protein n=1 Tax=Amycolatopsis kentuckyensis TaxID=218823 RepID=UPI000A39462E|nr:hypothetical protein [Amycolatopsis kentuckyensis]